MAKQRVLFFIYQMGAGGAARTLLNIMNNLDRDRYEPVLVTLNYTGSYEHYIREDVIFRKVSTTRLSRSVFQLAAIIKEENADLVFSTIPRVNTIATLAAKWAGVPNIVREADNLGGTFRENLQLKGFGIVYRLANGVVSLSEGVKDNLVQRYHLNRGKIDVIYNPVDIKEIDKQRSEPLIPEERHLFVDGIPTCITAGRLVSQKDQRTMLKALALVNEKRTVNLIILGEGELLQELTEEAKALGIKDRVSFVGFQGNPYKWFSHADLFLLTSRHEGFSHVLAEALACEVRVVSTDCQSGPAEVLDHGKYGNLVPVGDSRSLADAIEALLQQSPEEKERRIREGRERAVYFRAEDMVRRYEQVFEDTLRRSGKGGIRS